MLNAVLFLKYWVLCKCARLVMLQSFKIGAGQLCLSLRFLHPCMPFIILVWDAFCLSRLSYNFWCFMEACVAIVYALFFCLLVHELIAEFRMWFSLVNFGGSSCCTSCYFQNLVWAEPILESSQKGAVLGLVSVGVKMVSESTCLSPILLFLHPTI